MDHFFFIFDLKLLRLAFEDGKLGQSLVNFCLHLHWSNFESDCKVFNCIVEWGCKNPNLDYFCFLCDVIFSRISWPLVRRTMVDFPFQISNLLSLHLNLGHRSRFPHLCWNIHHTFHHRLSRELWSGWDSDWLSMIRFSPLKFFILGELNCNLFSFCGLSFHHRIFWIIEDSRLDDWMDKRTSSRIPAVCSFYDWNFTFIFVLDHVSIFLVLDEGFLNPLFYVSFWASSARAFILRFTWFFLNYFMPWINLRKKRVSWAWRRKNLFLTKEVVFYHWLSYLYIYNLF